ncbi:MAG: hypothetical protein AAGF25_00450 [Pseudomonadota bacterium]
MSVSFTNEDLTAYLDKECSPELAEKIARQLESDGELRSRIEKLKIDKDSLHAAFQELAPRSASVPKLITQHAPPATAGMPITKIAAGILVGAFLGASAMYVSTSPDQQDWMDAVASYQALYTTDTLKFVDQDDAQLTSELARVSATLGKDINLDDLQSFDALDYQRGQVLSFANQPLIQLAFLTKDGKAVALCITKATGTPDSGLNFSKLQGLEAATWSKGEYNYIIIGGEDKALISNAAKLFQERV